MPVYHYKGLTAQGRTTAGVLDAQSAKGVRLSLRKQGVFPTEILEQSVPEPSGLLAKVGLGLGRRISAQELALFTRQFASLLQAGLPLVEALEVLRDEADSKRHKALLTTLVNHIREGQSLGTALETLQPIFPPFYIHMARAGEASGRLEEILFQLADFWERQVQIQHKIVSTLIYPAIMSLVGIGVVFALMTFVVPRISTVFIELNQTLPTPTRIVIGLSTFLEKFWPWLFFGALGIGWALSRYLATPLGRERADAFILRLPLVGHLVRLVSLARFSSTLSTLLSSGVPMLTALDVAKRVTGNRVIEGAVETARLKVKEGGSLGATLRLSGMVPPLMIHLITVGEKGGTLEGMLHHCASLYEAEVDRSLTRLTSLLEPIMILAMGGFVLFLVLAVVLPLVDMTQMVR